MIDEISCVGGRLLLQLNQKLQGVRQNMLPFGGVHIIVVGDFYQLSPVFGPPICLDTEVVHLWRLFERVTLTENMRQAEDPRFSTLLEHARVGEMSPDDIQLLETRCIDECQWIQLMEECNRRDDIIVNLHYTNKRTTETNEQMLTGTGKDFVTVEAEDWIPGITEERKATFRAATCNLSLRVTKNLAQRLLLQLDFPYMVTHNIDTDDKLANGTIGYLKRIEYNGTRVWRIWLQPHDTNAGVGQNARLTAWRVPNDVENTNWFPLKRTQVTFPQTLTTIKRAQFPVVLAGATTIHKAQGRTLPKVVLHTEKYIQGDKMCFIDNQLFYVGLSRVSRLSDLFICKSLPGERKAAHAKSVTRAMHKIPTVDVVRGKQGKAITLGYQNIQGIGDKLTHLQNSILTKDIDALLLTETVQSLRQKNNLEIRRLTLAEETTGNARMGNGVAVFVDTEALQFDTTTVEDNCVRTTLIHRSLVIVTLYVRPNTPKNDVLQQIIRENDYATRRQSNILIVGDFNNTLQDSELQILANNHSLFPVEHDGMTHLRGGQLDKILTHTPGHVTVRTTPTYWSDHCFMTVALHEDVQTTAPTKGWQDTSQKKKGDMEEVNFNKLFSSTDAKRERAHIIEKQIDDLFDSDTKTKSDLDEERECEREEQGNESAGKPSEAISVGKEPSIDGIENPMNQQNDSATTKNRKSQKSATIEKTNSPRG